MMELSRRIRCRDGRRREPELGLARPRRLLARLHFSEPPPQMLAPRLRLVLLLAVAAAWSAGLLCLAAGEGGGGSCELSVERGGAVYNFSLAARTLAHRHGVLSEDGFYKVTMNDSSLWFQPCDQMIFNFDQPVCLDCEDCGGPLRCGTQCSALVSNNIGGTFVLLVGYIFTSVFPLLYLPLCISNDTGGTISRYISFWLPACIGDLVLCVLHFAVLGYDVCTTIGRASGSHIYLIDEGNPQKGVIVKMSSSKCSISVFIFCDSAVAQVSDKFSQSGSCDYATIIRHPSGCARSVSASGNGWGWLGTSFITILCLLGGYISIGAIYRYYFLGIRSVEAIPNLEFWISLLQKVKSVFVPSSSPRGRVRDSRGPYAPVNH